MRPTRRTPILLAILLAMGAAAAEDAGYAEGVELFRFQDARVRESSGLASSSRSDDFFFTHNDSGDGPFLYAVDRKGRTLVTLEVTGAKATDWEDIARGPDEQGRQSLYIGDIGNNSRGRSTLHVYRIPEPEVDATKEGVKSATEPAVRFDLAYEDGLHDSETLLVHPKTGQLFLVSKTTQDSGLYAAPVPLKREGTNRLKRVANLDFSELPATIRSLTDRIARLLTTGGDFSHDGSRMVIRTYTDAYEWRIEGDDVGKSARQKPLHIPLPPTRQGEAITYDRTGQSLLITTEGENAPTHLLRRR